MGRRKLLIMTAIVAVYAFCYANTPFLWQDKGVPIRKGSYVEWTGQMVTIGNDKAVTVWSDARNGNRELWAQAVDGNGIAWNNGEPVLIASSEAANESPALTATSDGNAIVAWVDYDYQAETGSIYAQKIAADGELMWEDNVLISRDNVRRSSKERNNDERNRCPYYPYLMDSLEMVPNNEGGAYIFWHDERNGATYEIYGMHLSNEGQLYSEEWIEGGILYTSGSGDKLHPGLCADGANGVILTYIAYSGGDYNGFVKRVLADGSIEWERGLPVGEEGDNLHEVSVAPFGENAFGLAFSYSSNRYRRVDANVLSIEGEFLWEEALPVDIDAPGSYFNQSLSRSVNTVDGGFAIVWKDDRERGENLYAQKFNIEGDRLWGNRGVRLAELNQEFIYQYDVEPDNDGGIIAVWEDHRSGGYRRSDVYVQHITAAGDLRWENGKPFVETANQNFEPAIRFSGDNLFLAWGDSGDNATGIHIQGYDSDFEAMFTAGGEIIYTGLDSIAGKQTAIKSGEYIYVVWQEGAYNALNLHLRVQKIDAEGNPQFAENGMVISEVSYLELGDIVSAVSHHNGGIVVAWTQRVGRDSKVFAQAVNPDGEMLWSDGGNGSGIRVTATDNEHNQQRPVIIRDGESYIIVWEEIVADEYWNYQQTIVAQKISAGSRVWGDDGVAITIPRQDEEYPNHIIEAMVEGSYLVWSQGSPAQGIYVKRIDENGQTADGWDDYGLRLTEPDEESRIVQNYPTALMTDKGLLVLWSQSERTSPGELSYSDIYGQMISEDGERLWGENGKEIAAYNYDQLLVTARYDEGYVYIAFIDSRIQSFRSDIAYQKIDLEGNLLWGEFAPFVTGNTVRKWSPQLVKSGNSLLITWRDTHLDFYRTDNLRMQLVSASTGQRFWGDDGLMVSDAFQGQEEYQLILMGNQNAFVVWADLRSGRSNYGARDLYAQKIDLSYNLNVDDDTLVPAKNMTLHANYPNPFNPDTNISFALAQNEIVSLQIYNVRGQLVRNLIDKDYREQGHHNVLWNGTDNGGNTVSSGVYLYKLDGEQENRTRKMILMK